MDPVLLAAAIAAVREGMQLAEAYANGAPDAETQLRIWLAMQTGYKAARAAWDAAGVSKSPPGVPA